MVPTVANAPHKRRFAHAALTNYCEPYSTIRHRRF